MAFTAGVLRRTIAVLAAGISRQRGISKISFCRNSSSMIGRNSGYSVRCMSEFKAPSPVESKGEPVYEDIDFSVADDPFSPSALRNGDADSVFVVNGASRGIGLQFVRSLLDRTKVSYVRYEVRNFGVLNSTADFFLGQNYCMLPIS